MSLVLGMVGVQAASKNWWCERCTLIRVCREVRSVVDAKIERANAMRPLHQRVEFNVLPALMRGAPLSLCCEKPACTTANRRDKKTPFLPWMHPLQTCMQDFSIREEGWLWS